MIDQLVIVLQNDIIMGLYHQDGRKYEGSWNIIDLNSEDEEDKKYNTDFLERVARQHNPLTKEVK